MTFGRGKIKMLCGLLPLMIHIVGSAKGVLGKV